MQYKLLEKNLRRKNNGASIPKKISLIPGVRLNLGKKGGSISLGSKEASINVGKKGLFANIGLPGTGFSFRTRFGSLKTPQL